MMAIVPTKKEIGMGVSITKIDITIGGIKIGNFLGGKCYFNEMRKKKHLFIINYYLLLFIILENKQINVNFKKRTTKIS